MEDEYVFTFPVPNGTSIENGNIYQIIEQMMQNMQNDTNLYNFVNESDDSIQLNIEFEVVYPANQHSQNNDDLEGYFKNCKEINEKISKPLKIKKDDLLLKEECLICMDKYKIGEFKRLLPKCSHYFHKRCIDKWLKKKCTCPVCRCNLLQSSEETNLENNTDTPNNNPNNNPNSDNSIPETIISELPENNL
jgi:hypothetical protein